MVRAQSAELPSDLSLAPGTNLRTCSSMDCIWSIWRASLSLQTGQRAWACMGMLIPPGALVVWLRRRSSGALDIGAERCQRMYAEIWRILTGGEALLSAGMGCGALLALTTETSESAQNQPMIASQKEELY